MVRCGPATMNPSLGGVVEAFDDFDADFEKRRESGIGSPQGQRIEGCWRAGCPILCRNPKPQGRHMAYPISKCGHPALPSPRRAPLATATVYNPRIHDRG